MSEERSTMDFGAMTSVIQFLMELDKLKRVERRTRLIGNDRNENAAEHSWHLAMACMSLAPCFDRHLDLLRVIKMALLHDVVEIDAGDVLAYDLVARAQIKAQERAAAQRIFGLLPAAAARPFLALWEEYEAEETAEARFAGLLDRVLPVIQNLHNHGESWKENNVRFEQVIARNADLAESWPEMWRYLHLHLTEAREKGWLLS